MDNIFFIFLKPHLTSIVWIIILFILAKALLRKIANKIISFINNSKAQKGLKQRTQTLGSIIVTGGNVIIYSIILLMVLGLFGIDLKPILTGAGILGIAIGFGSQTLVKDFVSGLFILLENQYTIGDKIKIGAFTGEVSKMYLRSTVLLDEEGNEIYISNSNIKDVINYSRK